MTILYFVTFLLMAFHSTTGFVSLTTSSSPRTHAFGLSAATNDFKDVRPVPVVMHIQELLGRHRWQQLQSLSNHHSHLIVGLENANPEFGRNVLSQLFDNNTKTTTAATTSPTQEMINEYQLDRVLRSLGFVWLRQQQLNKVFPHSKTVKARDLKRLLVGNPHQLRNALLNLAA